MAGLQGSFQTLPKAIEHLAKYPLASWCRDKQYKHVVVAFSYGTAIVKEFLVNHNVDVDHFVFLGGTPGAEQKTERYRALEKLDTRSFIQGISTLYSDKAEIQDAVYTYLSGLPTEVIEQYRDYQGSNANAETKSPVLSIYGHDEHLVEIPEKSDIHVVPDGHAVHLEATQEVAQLMVKALHQASS